MLITIDLQAVIGQFVGGQKPGQCPVSDIITTCDCPTNQMECYTDFHCPLVLCMHSILHVTLAKTAYLLSFLCANSMLRLSREKQNVCNSYYLLTWHACYVVLFLLVYH